MNLNSSVQSKESKSSKIAMIVMGVIVVGLLIAVIVVAVGKNNQKQTAETAVSGEAVVDELAKKEAAPSAETENLAPVANESATISSQEATVVAGEVTTGIIAVSDVTEMPATGPLDFVPFAVLSGAFLMYFSSFFIAKQGKVLKNGL